MSWNTVSKLNWILVPYKWPFLKCKIFYNEMNFLIKKRLNIFRFSGPKVIWRSTSLLQHLSRSQRNWRTITSHEKTGNVNHIFAQKSKFGFYLKIGRNKGLFFQSSKRNTFWRSFFIGFKKTSELFICRPQKLRIKNRFFCSEMQVTATNSALPQLGTFFKI